MTILYSPAPQAQIIGENLIVHHHDHLIGQRVDYIFRSEAAKSAGRTIWGRAKKVTGLNAYLASAPRELGEIADPVDPDPFFLIELAEDIWLDLNGKQRIALVDHELSHCKVTLNDSGEMVLSIAGHDVEEFEAVVRRNGLWHPDVKHFAKVAADVGDQQSFFAAAPAPSEG